MNKWLPLVPLVPVTWVASMMVTERLVEPRSPDRALSVPPSPSVARAPARPTDQGRFPPADRVAAGGPYNPDHRPLAAEDRVRLQQTIDALNDELAFVETALLEMQRDLFQAKIDRGEVEPLAPDDALPRDVGRVAYAIHEIQGVGRFMVTLDPDEHPELGRLLRTRREVRTDGIRALHSFFTGGT